MNRKEQKEFDKLMKNIKDTNSSFQRIIETIFWRIICLESQVALLSDQVHGVDD